MRKIKVGVVGLGYWGPNLIRNFYRHEGFEMVWGCDLLEKNLINIKKDYPFLKLTRNFQDLLSDKSLDLIAVATPPETHYNLGEKVLMSKKHLWIEKPFTTSLNLAKKLFLLAQKNHCYLHVDFPFIFYSPVQKIKELVEKKKIGTPYYYTSLRTNLGLIQKEIDVIWDLAPHDLSILLYLFPKLKPIKVYSAGSQHLKNYHKKQVANLVINFNNNFTAYIYLSWLSPIKMRLITLVGSKKMVLFDDIDPVEKIKVYDKELRVEKNKITPFNPIYRNGDITIPYIDNREEALYKQINFLFENLNRKIFKYYTGEIAINILDILGKIEYK